MVKKGVWAGDYDELVCFVLHLAAFFWIRLHWLGQIPMTWRGVGFVGDQISYILPGKRMNTAWAHTTLAIVRTVMSISQAKKPNHYLDNKNCRIPGICTDAPAVQVILGSSQEQNWPGTCELQRAREGYKGPRNLDVLRRLFGGPDGAHLLLISLPVGNRNVFVGLEQPVVSNKHE